MKESEFTARVCNELKRHNALVLPIVAGTMGDPGWPDRYVCHRRWKGFLEFKGFTTRLRPKQVIIIRMLRERGQPVFVIRAPDRIEDENGDLLGTFQNVKELLDALQACSQPESQGS